jgi:hypothetical protein
LKQKGTLLPLHSIFTKRARDPLANETISGPMTWSNVNQAKRTRSGTAMSDRINQSSEQIDRPTTRSICRAVGERLQQDIRPETTELPSRLRFLMDELRRQDRRN